MGSGNVKEPTGTGTEKRRWRKMSRLILYKNFRIYESDDYYTVADEFANVIDKFEKKLYSLEDVKEYIDNYLV